MINTGIRLLGFDSAESARIALSIATWRERHVGMPDGAYLVDGKPVTGVPATGVPANKPSYESALSRCP